MRNPFLPCLCLELLEHVTRAEHKQRISTSGSNKWRLPTVICHFPSRRPNALSRQEEHQTSFYCSVLCLWARIESALHFRGVQVFRAAGSQSLGFFSSGLCLKNCSSPKCTRGGREFPINILIRCRSQASHSFLETQGSLKFLNLDLFFCLPHGSSLNRMLKVGNLTVSSSASSAQHAPCKPSSHLIQSTLQPRKILMCLFQEQKMCQGHLTKNQEQGCSHVAEAKAG